MEYKANLPYPKIEVTNKNVFLARELFSNYAGDISEDTAIHNYIYQSLIIKNDNIKNILKQIAIVEMHHLEILGKLIIKLGLTPMFLSISNNQTKWFSGEYITYEKDIQKILLNNIKNEELAIQNYEKIIMKTDDNKVKIILKRIILDEKLHIEIFKHLYQIIKTV